jgi:hypothetical protein
MERTIPGGEEEFVEVRGFINKIEQALVMPSELDTRA